MFFGEYCYDDFDRRCSKHGRPELFQAGHPSVDDDNQAIERETR